MRLQPPPIDLKEFAEEAAKDISAQRLAARYQRSVRTVMAIAARESIKLKTNQIMKAEARRVLGPDPGSRLRSARTQAGHMTP